MANIPFLNNAYFSAKVGIGTDSPIDVLSLEKTTNINVLTDYKNSTGNFSTGVLVGGNFAINESNVATRLTIEKTSGNVGIGTTSPAADFVVSHQGTSGIEIEANFQMGVNSILSFDRTVGALAYETMRLSANDFWFTALGVERMRITSTGNVGIGTNSPDALLELSKSVNGAQGATLRLTNAIGGSGAGVAVEFVGPGTQPIHAKIITVDAGAYDSNLIFQTKATTTAGALSDRLTIDNVGAIQFNAYDSTNNTGTPTYLLGTDTSGNIVKTNTVPGSAAGPYLPLAGGTMTGNTVHNDNVKSIYGTASDGLEIYHNGTNSYITDTGTGNLEIRSNFFKVKSTVAEDMIWAQENAGVSLFHNNIVKFATTSTGVTVTGALSTTTNVSIGNNAFFVDGGKALFGASYDLQIYHDGSNSYIKETGTGTLNLQGSTQVLIAGINGQVGVQFIEGGKVGLRHANVQKLATTSTGVSVTGDIQIDSALLSNQENTDVDTGTETVASVAIATYTAAFFDFVVKKTTNVRSGTVYACHDGTNVVFTETSTNDLGDTSDVTLSVDISGTNMRLLATVTSDDWSVKSLIRAI